MREWCRSLFYQYHKKKNLIRSFCRLGCVLISTIWDQYHLRKNSCDHKLHEPCKALRFAAVCLMIATNWCAFACLELENLVVGVDSECFKDVSPAVYICYQLVLLSKAISVGWPFICFIVCESLLCYNIIVAADLGIFPHMGSKAVLFIVSEDIALFNKAKIAAHYWG